MRKNRQSTNHVLSPQGKIKKRAEEIAEGLYPHQIEGIAFLLGRRRALLADDMGLGKTRQSIIAMVEAEAEGPYLVICPSKKLAEEIETIISEEKEQLGKPQFGTPNPEDRTQPK